MDHNLQEIQELWRFGLLFSMLIPLSLLYHSLMVFRWSIGVILIMHSKLRSFCTDFDSLDNLHAHVIFKVIQSKFSYYFLVLHFCITFYGHVLKSDNFYRLWNIVISELMV